MPFNGKELLKDAALWVADKAQESVTGFTMDWGKGELLFKGSDIAWNLASYTRELSPGIVYTYDKNGVRRADGTLNDPYVEEYNEQRRQMNEADWKALDEEIGRLFPELERTKPWDILPNTNMCFRNARAWRQPVDPLMLDLDGDGLELKRADGSVLFDHNADTIRTGTGWIGADDGLLVRDLNANVTVDSGRELFGIDTFKRDGTLQGGAGDDTLQGGAGNDILAGGRYDTWNGNYDGSGNDTYQFGRGDGQDRIVDVDTTPGNTDVVHSARMSRWTNSGFAKRATTCRSASLGTDDKLTLNNWYAGSQYHVEEFRTSDGHVLIDTQVQNLVQAMASFAPPPPGQTTLAPSYQDSLAPLLAANWK